MSVATEHVGQRTSGAGRVRVRSRGALRIGVVLEGLAMGGCPINAIDLARCLRDRGHHVVLVAPDERAPVSVLPHARASGFDVLTIPVECGLRGRSLALRRVRLENDLDVLHVCATWLATSAVLACGWSGRCVPVALNWLMQNDFRTTSRMPLVVGTGDLHREALAIHGPRSYLLEPPVDLERDRPDHGARTAFRAAHGIAEDDVAVVLVGRIDALPPQQLAEPDHRHADKVPGIMLALEVVERARDPRLRLVLVGDGTAMEGVRRRAEEVNVAMGRSAVVLTGALDDPHPAYAAADVGLAMGGSALRVMAHGVPLVVLGNHGFSRTFSPSTADYFFEQGYFGVEPPAEPVGELLAQVRRLLDAEERRRLGRWGRQVVRERHALESGAALLEQVYLDALSSGDSRWERAYDIGFAAGRDLVGKMRRRWTSA